MNVGSNRPRADTGGSIFGKFQQAAPITAASEPETPQATSTTKALLLSIAVPRIYRVYIPPKEEAKSTPPISTVSSSRAMALLPEFQQATMRKRVPSNLSLKSLDSNATASTSNHNKKMLKKDEGYLIPNDHSPTRTTDSSRKSSRSDVISTGDKTPPPPTSGGSGTTKSVLSKVASLLGGGDEQDEEVDKDEEESAKLQEMPTEQAVRVVEIKEPDDPRRKSKPNSRQVSSGSILAEHQVGYTEADDEDGGRQKSLVEHVITKEEMQLVTKIEPSMDELPPSFFPGEDEIQDADDAALSAPIEKPKHRRLTTADSNIMSDVSDAIKSFFGAVNKNEDSVPTTYLSQDEAVAAIKKYEPLRPFSQSAIQEAEDEENDDHEHNPNCGPMEILPKLMKPNTEIKLEELVRLTFRNLYMENHFYNAPIYTNVETRLLQEADMDEWVELSVMVKQSSIGIILERLERIGVGSSVGTIAIFKAELLRACDILNDAAPKDEIKPNIELANDPSADPEAATKERAAKIEAARAEWKNAASRLRVEQVSEQIHSSAALSLDYLSLLTVASILAGIGLVTDNSVVIVASMLVSPIMGPVMAMTFGSRVLDWELARLGIWNEFLSLLIAVFVGVAIGVTTGFAPAAEGWPTEQMAIRGDVSGLVAGIAIAIPSGMGVALSLLENNTSSLVGVAISASLLPPAVNAGICWVFAILIRTGAVTPDPASILDEDGNEYNYNLIATISFALTMINIVCIWVSGIIMFQIKEVAPTRSKNPFWARDIKVARAIQKGKKGDVDLEAVKVGLQEAIAREREEEKKGTNDQRPVLIDRRPGRNDSLGSFRVQGPRPLDDGAHFYSIEDIGKILGFEGRELGEF